MSKIDLKKYQTFIFDCDGVVLNSNNIKTEAFYTVARSYGSIPAQILVDYHLENGGVSRYKKLEYFLTEILGKIFNQPELNVLLKIFGEEVKKALLVSGVADGLDELRNKTKHANWLIVSGGDQSELRDVFAARGLDDYFDGGIFGSPDNKHDILNREILSGNIKGEALFLGDSKYDYQSAINAKLSFLFITNWTDVKCWEDWVKVNLIQYKSSISEMY